MFNPSLAIVGAGKAGTALGSALADKGCLICGVASRSLASAQKLAARYGALASIAPAEVTADAEVILITTPDDYIAETVQKVSRAGGFKKGQFVYHVSGALGLEALTSAQACGAFAGCIHPLQTLIGSPTDKNLLAACYFSLDGDKQALAMAEKLVALIGGTSFTISSEKRTLYHAAASVTSNYLVILLHAAIEMLKGAGVTDGIKVLMPLIAGTLENIMAQGTTAALTGPISRGDVKTVAKHFIALHGSAEADLYAALARYTTAIAIEKGTISRAQAAEILQLAK